MGLEHILATLAHGRRLETCVAELCEHPGRYQQEVVSRTRFYCSCCAEVLGLIFFPDEHDYDCRTEDRVYAANLRSRQTNATA